MRKGIPVYILIIRTTIPTPKQHRVAVSVPGAAHVNLASPHGWIHDADEPQSNPSLVLVWLYCSLDINLAIFCDAEW